MTPFTTRVIDVIKSIPWGKVMTYGQIAARAGNPRGARQVARILHAMSRPYRLPWHRVVNAKGCISLREEGYQLQKKLLEEEGIRFKINGGIELALYLYDPQGEEMWED